MFNTIKYSNVLTKIISNYNSSYHSEINKAPNDVTEGDQEVMEIMNKKYNKAKEKEITFNVGDTDICNLCSLPSAHFVYSPSATVS